MKFTELPLKGAYLIELDPFQDERGFFADTWCRNEFEKRGLDISIAHCALSYNRKKGTLRGLHYQIPPHEEAKLVRCAKGAIFDVIIDLRPDSKTFKQWFSVELNDENRKSLFIPKGFAHGFQTLVDNTEVAYQISEFFHPECYRGIRWDDPVFSINWPFPVSVISEKDKALPVLTR